jgi:type II secretory pathway pseudopilin PulG
VTPALLTSIGALLTALFAALLPFYRERQRAKAAESQLAETKARIDADAEAASQRMRDTAEEWMRSKLAELLDDAVTKLDQCERRSRDQHDEFTSQLAQIRREFDALRTEHAQCPSLVRDVLRSVAKLDPYRTPTQAEIDGIRTAIRRAGGSESDITGLFGARGVQT